MKKNLCCKPQISARPYQLMCVLCRLGAGDPVNRLRDGNLDDIFQSIRKDPRVTLDLRSYEGDKYTGKDGDSPRGVLFHMYQDEAIRGSVKNPKYLDRAQAGLGRLLDIAEFIATIKNICWFDRKAAPAWRGCPLADKGYYELGRKRIKTISAEILPAFNAGKSQAELDAIKKNTAQKILDSNLIRIFPSHLAYIVNTAFQYECRRAVPIHHDNLWEPAEAMRRNPEIPVMLVPDHCMVCPPCGGYDMEGSGLCRINPLNMKPADKINAMGGVVTLSILRSLGLEYYQKIPAHRLLQLAKERLTADHILFNYVGAPPSFAAFERTLQDGLGFLDAFKDPKAVLRRVETLLADRRVRALLPQDEREYAGRTVAEVKKHIASGNRYEAYLALTESAFAHTWKQYMELIQRGYARLPKMIQAETGVAAADRVLKAIPVKRNIGKSMPVPYSTGFVTVPGVNRPAIAETGLRSGYDRDNLYVEIVCADADTRKLKADARVGVDLINIGRKYDRRIDDAVLLVLQPDSKAGDMFLFTANCRGVKLGERYSNKDGRTQSEWINETVWAATPGVSGGAWRIEMTIPFSVFGARTARGAAWQINAHRFFRNDMLDHHSWAPTSAWNMHDPKQCGRLVIG